MKKILVSLIFLTAFSIVINAQENKPEILKEPADWEFEKFALPPSFAPTIAYKGTEELRFAHGMFKKDSADYFTYVFVAQIDSITSVSQTDIKDYLVKYYKGLCAAIAADRKLVIDTSQINAAVEKKKDTKAKEASYNASVNLFGVFVDGAPVKLNMEISVITNTATKKTYLFFITSPRDKKELIWKELYEIRKKAIKVING